MENTGLFRDAQTAPKSEIEQVESAGRDETRKRIADIKSFLREQDITITVFDEALVRRLIEKVTVHEGRFVVTFRSGVIVEVPS